ncbi:MAG: glycosyltransferase family 4 protein [Epsilonproteobacteria bacterium]|nr:glycosyltransferase family 4 protein [Campylobacterota bacterium]
MATDKKSVLVIGPMYSKDLSKAGGTLVLFEQFLQDFRELGIKHKAINSNTQVYKNTLHAFVIVMMQFFTNVFRYDHISLHGTSNHFIMMAPIVVFVSKLFGKSISMRKFAGNFHQIYEKSSPLKQKLIRYVLKNSDVNYFETQYLVDYFIPYNKNTFWFPNVRRRGGLRHDGQTYKKRFVFISLVSYEKGMDDLLEVAQKLDDSYTIDIYGTLHESKYTKAYIDSCGATYHRALAPDEVLPTMNTYDVLVLPSHREGYPGILLEAFSIGMPVLTTSLLAIKEIVDEGENGILVEPKDTISLYAGFKVFDEENYKAMCTHAYDSFEPFDSMRQTTAFLEFINR